jgi:glycerophosphoryl diester phosphodiesterase
MTRVLNTFGLLMAILAWGCTGADPKAPSPETMMAPDAPAAVADTEPLGIEIQGHRGARGLLPENSIPGFVISIREGADVLEMDLCIAKDGNIIVSHEPWMSHLICTTPDGDEIPASQERRYNLHQMTTAEIQAFDCGMKAHPGFPDQRHLPIQKPTLAEVVKVTEDVPMLIEGRQIRYNLEIKHRKELEPEFCPEVSVFVQTVIAEVRRLGIEDRTCIQSFSADALNAVHQQAPNMTTAWLTNSEESVSTELARINFKPSIYSPQWERIDANDVHGLQQKDIRVIPWTVNEPEDLFAVMQMGVDGIITDYPDRLYDLRKN